MNGKACLGMKARVQALAAVGLTLSALAAKHPVPPRAPLTPGAWATAAQCPKYRPPAVRPTEAVQEFLWLEAEEFADYGKWRLDTQFVHKMGSAYLIASGVGEPIGEARTTIDLPRAGTWRVWARTKDWLPEHSPGAFAVVVNGVQGLRLGVSRRVGWAWESAGSFQLKKGPVDIRLRDLSGCFGRCDALILTTDLGYIPPERPEEVERERFCLKGQSPRVRDGGAYDIVVVGAGPGGVPAAIAAARGGAKVALIGDRPVLGGNASNEIGVNMCGAAHDKTAARETGIVEEANCLRAQYPAPGLSEAYATLCAAETNLAVFTCQRMEKTEMRGERVASVVCRNTLSGGWTRYSGRLFVDATGDGWLGYFAGADYLEGREGRKAFGERLAPERPDTFTMSGLLHEPKVGVSYRAEKVAQPRPYVTPEWAKVLPRGFTRKVGNVRGQWWIEHSGFFDDCADPERARDELIRISFAYWGWLRNESPLREQAAEYEMVEIPIVDGRREARRLVGDYVLTGEDCLAGRIFPDAVAYGGWSLDVHDPLGMSAPDSDGWCPDHPLVPVYTIPYRSLYSKNVPNLMMAGRDISVTHLALGSTRVQCTCSVIGQAVGTAAAMCVGESLDPRQLGQTRLGELQQRLLRDDAYIPGLRNEHPGDLARRAAVTASSAVSETRRWSPIAKPDGYIVYGGASPEGVIDGISRPLGSVAHAWVSQPGLPQWIRLDLEEPTTVGEVRLTFDSDLEFVASRCRRAEELVRDYRLEGTEDGERWFALADVRGNFQRHRVHRFPPRYLKAVRLTVLATYGSEEANVFEIRIY